MHPIISQEIAACHGKELRRLAELQRAHVPAPLPRDRYATSHRVRSWLAQAWALVTAFRSA